MMCAVEKADRRPCGLPMLNILLSSDPLATCLYVCPECDRGTEMTFYRPVYRSTVDLCHACRRQGPTVRYDSGRGLMLCDDVADCAKHWNEVEV